MRQKVISILVLFYSIQLIIACCPNDVLQQTINSVFTRPLVLVGNRFVEVSSQEFIDKEDLLLEVVLDGNQINIGGLPKELKKFSFQSSYASIDCDEPSIVYANRVSRIEILVVDTNNAESDITSDFVIEESGQSIADYLSENTVGIFDGFLLDLENTDNVPDSASFKTRVFLDDGNMVVTETNRINFN